MFLPQPRSLLSTLKVDGADTAWLAIILQCQIIYEANCHPSAPTYFRPRFILQGSLSTETLRRVEMAPTQPAED